MTYQPPPPPPPPGRPGADPKSINPLDWGILAAGVLAFIFSFVSYYSYSVGPFSGHVNAWHGFFGWFAMLCALAGSALVGLALFAPTVKLPVPMRLSGLAAYALGTLCVILALFVVPGDTSGAAEVGIDINKGHGVGYWLSLIVILAGLVMSLMRLQQQGGQLPGALGNLPNIGAYGPGATQPPNPYGQPGQTPPPPPAGYAPPPPPPSGPPMP